MDSAWDLMLDPGSTDAAYASEGVATASTGLGSALGSQIGIGQNH